MQCLNFVFDKLFCPSVETDKNTGEIKVAQCGLRRIESALTREYDKNEVTKGLLIDKIGIDQKYRCFGIGRYILQFCIGLTKAISTNSQIRIIIFETTYSLAAKIYHPKYGFDFLKKDKNLVWAYKAII